MNANGTTDESLLSRFLGGESEALGELAGRYENQLLGLAWGLLDGRSDLARDAVQETWLRVIRYGASFNHRSLFKTWIYRITINQCKNLRKKNRQDSSESSLNGESKTNDEPQSSSSKPAPNELRQALKRLDRRRSDVILLCYHAGLNHEQAAEVLGIPLGTLKSRLHAALRELRETLVPETAQ